MSDLIQCRVRGLIMDERSKAPIVILQEEEGERVLPIWIGEPEARAIGSVMAREKLERPMTHDLMANMLRSLKAEVAAITITSLRENTFFAEIHLRVDGEQVLVDARPSDSIALALRTGAPIFVSQAVLEGGGAGVTAKSTEPSREEKAAQLKKFLEEMDPGDFGSFGI